MNEREELATRKELVQSAGDVSRELRRDFDWTQAVLGERADLSRQEISMIECGNRIPNWETICRLASAFEMEEDEFVKRCKERRQALKEGRQVAEEKAEKYKP